MPDTPWLDRLCEQVADRDRVNWSVVAPALHDSGALSRDQRAQLELLQLLDEVGVLHATLQAQDPNESIESDRGRSHVEDDETLTAWGRYRLEEKVGRGGFGSVYRAWDPVLEMAVAIKILHRRFNAAHLRERLIAEGRALAQVSHPNVVRVLNVEQNEDRLGLVMEFLRGETLEARIGVQGVMNEREAALVGEDVCRALTAVHAVKLIHRDVKARNIIRDRSGRIVLMDFGAGIWEGRATDHAGAEGTPLYMAPEVMRGEQAGMASDVYSVGVLLFYLVTQRYPYQGATVDALRTVQAARPATSLLELRPDLPLPFAAVIARALARDPRDRYATPTALLQALVAMRDDGTPWTSVAIRAVASLGLGVVLLTLAGMLCAASFNSTLKRAEYVTESVRDWFQLGVQSLVLPIVLTALGIGLAGLLASARRVAVAGSVRARSIDRRLLEWCQLFSRRLSLDDPQIGSCWLMLATALFAAAAWTFGFPLFQALSSDIGTAPAEVLSVLSPPMGIYRTNYRIVLSLLVAANALGWYALTRSASSRGVRLPRWLLATEIAALVLLCGSMEIPYRLTRDAKIFPVVEWASERCFLLGERRDEALLFCPTMHPRDRRVKTSTEHIKRLPIEPQSPFGFFAPPTDGPPRPPNPS